MPNSNRLVKNSLYMYIRMFFTMIISFYSSRILLNTIGVEDYGIYNVVGSVITMVSMLQAFFAMTTQRFLNYEMGRGNHDKLQLIFNMSIIINAIISLLFVFVVETIGYYFFTYEINIDPDRMFAAKWVFQLSIISAVVMIMTSPYDALIIANEKINFYALIAVLKNFLNLIIIYLIPLGGFDRLIFYAFLLLIVQLVVRVVCSIYCKLNFSECKCKRCWDSNTFKELFSFAGWQLLGTSAYNISQSGLNLLFNIFGGPVVNAARGIAYQVNAAIYQFTNNINVAITPYSIKAMANDDKENFLKMFYLSSKILFVITYCVSIPVIYLSEELLKIWLGFVPDFTKEFVIIVLIYSLVRSVHSPIDVLFKAIGKIKLYQIVECILLTLPLLVSYILLKNECSVVVAFSTIILFEFLNLLSVILVAERIVGIDKVLYMKSIISMILVCSLVAVLLYFLNYIVNYNWIVAVILSIIIDLFCLLYFYFVSLDKNERNIINGLLLKFKKNNTRL